MSLRLYSSGEQIDDSFDQRIASELDALDNLHLDQSTVLPASILPSSTLRMSNDRVGNRENLSSVFHSIADNGVEIDSSITTTTASNEALCENLVDLAVDQSQVEKLSGKDKGTRSDEVRIMEKVLGPKVSYKSNSEIEVGRRLNCPLLMHYRSPEKCALAR